MNKNLVFLVGRLVADPELRYLTTGTPVANFAVAVNRTTRKGDAGFQDDLDGFFDCEAFGGQALALTETCPKGTEVQLTGALRQKKFKTNGENSRTVSRIEIRVESIAPVLDVRKVINANDSAEAAPAAQPA
ncbi:MAG: single-stranded DNA-binding protein [Actinomycetota bacterium]|nr:single-stranded DNA-binding protein [Actinomycetota bacterium]